MAIKEAEPAQIAASSPLGGERYRFDVRSFHAMIEAGILGEDERVELIEGEVIEMSPINPQHVAVVAALTEFLLVPLVGKAFVTAQSPFTLSEQSEPQPDLILARYRADRYRHAHPTSPDILLVIEVSQTSLRYDRARKVRLYGAAGLPEYWIVNLVDNTLEVYRQPAADGYSLLQKFRPGDAVSPLAFPDVSLDVAAILPPAEAEK